MPASFVGGVVAFELREFALEFRGSLFEAGVNRVAALEPVPSSELVYSCLPFVSLYGVMVPPAVLSHALLSA